MNSFDAQNCSVTTTSEIVVQGILLFDAHSIMKINANQIRAKRKLQRLHLNENRKVKLLQSTSRYKGYWNRKIFSFMQ